MNQMTQTSTQNNNINNINGRVSFDSTIAESRPSIQISEHSDSRRNSRSQEPRLIASTVPVQKLSPFARRGSLSAIADSFRSRSKSRSPSHHRKSVDKADSGFSPRSSLDITRTWSRRSSSSAKSTEEAPYADVVQAQERFMKDLRTKQHILHVSHNADGLPLPPFPGTEERERRRSSLTHILGFDKPLLAR
ncbi:hypothetical protein BG004_000944 [Podila humilis]|nr:hypothetical protein BG004_000944 [Podila humilis]